MHKAYVAVLSMFDDRITKKESKQPNTEVDYPITNLRVLLHALKERSAGLKRTKDICMHAHGCIQINTHSYRNQDLLAY